MNSIENDEITTNTMRSAQYKRRLAGIYFRASMGLMISCMRGLQKLEGGQRRRFEYGYNH